MKKLFDKALVVLLVGVVIFVVCIKTIYQRKIGRPFEEMFSTENIFVSLLITFSCFVIIGFFAILKEYWKNGKK